MATKIPENHINLATGEPVSRARKQEERTTGANEVALALSTLMLGEIISISPTQEVMAVPGGWLFTCTHKAGISTTFVPQPPQRPQHREVPPSIVMPTH